MTRLVLVRHGRTAWNADGRFQGQADIALDDVGRAQASALAPVIAGLRPSAVYSSPLLRARDTAETLASGCGLSVTFDERLREINVGSWAGKRMADAVAQLPQMAEFLRTGVDFRRSETGETASEAGERVTEALRSIAAQHADGAVVVVGHGLSLRMGLLGLLAWDMQTGLALRGLWNCSWSVVELRDRWRLLSYNNAVASEAGHDQI